MTTETPFLARRWANGLGLTLLAAESNESVANSDGNPRFELMPLGEYEWSLWSRAEREAGHDH